METINILIIDDNPADLRLLRYAVEQCPVKSKVEFAMDGEEALSYINKEMEFEDEPTPNLIFLDLNLPKQNGFNILKTIKQKPEYKDTRVVIVSGSEAISDKMTAMNLDADSYLNKIADLDMFLANVKKEVLACNSSLTV